MQSFIKYLLRTYYVLDPVPDSGDIAMNQIDTSYCLHSIDFTFL